MRINPGGRIKGSHQGGTNVVRHVNLCENASGTVKSHEGRESAFRLRPGTGKSRRRNERLSRRVGNDTGRHSDTASKRRSNELLVRRVGNMGPTGFIMSRRKRMMKKETTHGGGTEI